MAKLSCLQSIDAAERALSEVSDFRLLLLQSNEGDHINSKASWNGQEWKKALWRSWHESQCASGLLSCTTIDEYCDEDKLAEELADIDSFKENVKRHSARYTEAAADRLRRITENLRDAESAYSRFTTVGTEIVEKIEPEMRRMVEELLGSKEMDWAAATQKTRDEKYALKADEQKLVQELEEMKAGFEKRKALIEESSANLQQMRDSLKAECRATKHASQILMTKLKISEGLSEAPAEVLEQLEAATVEGYTRAAELHRALVPIIYTPEPPCKNGERCSEELVTFLGINNQCVPKGEAIPLHRHVDIRWDAENGTIEKVGLRITRERLNDEEAESVEPLIEELASSWKRPLLDATSLHLISFGAAWLN